MKAFIPVRLITAWPSHNPIHTHAIQNSPFLCDPEGLLEVGHPAK